MARDRGEPAGGPLSRPAWIGWIAQQGEMGARVAAYDWASTPLGPIEDWSTTLRTSAMLCVGSLFPMSVRWGPELTLIYNDACREVYGAERYERGLGRPTVEVWADVSDVVTERIASSLRHGRAYFAVDRLVPMNRRVPLEETYFTFSYTPIVDDDATVRGVYSTFIETTREVLAARRLRTLASLGRDLGACRTESELAKVAVRGLADNRADHPAGALYRAPDPGQDAGAPLASFGEALPAAQVTALVRACLAEGRPQHSDVAPDAGLHVAGLHAHGIWDPDGDAATHVLVLAHHASRPWDEAYETYVSLLATTLGSALLSQAELRAERMRAARASALGQAKSAFLAGISHELRTPLALIAAPLRDAIERTAEPEQRRALEMAEANVTRLSHMVDSMLDFSRLEAGRLVPQITPTDVALLIRGLAASFAPAFERGGLEFVCEACDLSRPALADRDIVERIVSNLLSNALKFTATGSVRLVLAEESRGYRIDVTDTGLGIDPKDHQRVFAGFARLPPKPGARASIGAGIGLAMVRQLAGVLGGSVTLASKLGEGSTFSVHLPFEPPAYPDAPGQSLIPRPVSTFVAEVDSWTPPVAPSRAPANGPRLLVVEDDPQLAGFLADSLSDTYRVETAPDGTAALAAMRRDCPDIVLSDLTMPGVDGLGLLDGIRDDPALRDVPVLLLSSRVGIEHSASALGRGADDYVTKPFTMADLRARLEANLARVRERSLDNAWRRAVMSGISDGVLVFDAEGEVLEINRAFTDLLGYSMADGPIRAPYPWWPTPEEDAEAADAIRRSHEAALAGEYVSGEFLFYDRDRNPVWVWTTGARVLHEQTGLSASVRTVRDIRREKAAQERRATAARVSADFGALDDLATLLSAAEYGFELLFFGISTIRLSVPGRPDVWFSSGRARAAEELPPEVATGLAGSPSPDTTSLRPGILLVPQTTTHASRAWIQFPRPRRIGVDEMIVADLLAQSFGVAVDRVIVSERAADREANLQQAVESHRLIGQAIGILVERHRILPNEAFDLLKAASQKRNLKLRDIAARVIETGAEPSEA